MLTTQQAANRLGVSTRRVVSLIKSGDLKAQKFGSSWAVDEESVDKRLSTEHPHGRPKYGEKNRDLVQTHTLMCKNQEVLDFVYQKRSKTVLDIPKLSNPELAPVGACSGLANPTALNLGQWISERYIPKNRINVSKLLKNSGLSDTSELMFRSLGLNLTDQYWFKPPGEPIRWEDVNFFDNEYEGDRDASGPGSGTPGMLEKWWERRNGRNFLIKGSSIGEREPYAELLATRLYTRLMPRGEFVEYSIEEIDGKPHSVCESFVKRDMQLVTMRDILACYGRGESEPHDYGKYVQICKNLGMEDIESHLSMQIVCDFLTANIDRHDMNLGLIRDANTLEFVGAAPIFDNGRSFYFDAQRKSDFDDRPYFHESHPFSPYPMQQLACASDYSAFDEDKLRGFADEIVEVLSMNQLAPEWFPELAARQFDVQLQRVLDMKAERMR